MPQDGDAALWLVSAVLRNVAAYDNNFFKHNLVTYGPRYR